ncbi:hypothetical protein [Streptomyces sp. NPDC002215]|uniref:hypothetical protein n=1 Tax=Streptomyces sp. NPDC002215 TaxID=3154412 RepID=UPI0033328DD8
MMDEYLSTNRMLMLRIIGARITDAVRLLDHDSAEDLRTEWGPVVLTFGDGEQVILDVEEAKSNLMLRDAHSIPPTSAWYAGFHIRAKIIEPVASDPLGFLLTEQVVGVEVISREPDPGVPDSFAMCGMRIKTESGHQVCIGTHLTDLLIPEVAFFLPEDVDPELQYRALHGDEHI